MRGWRASQALALPPTAGVGLDEQVSETPLYDATVSATLERLRAEAAEQATRHAQAQISAARQQAAQARAAAEQARHEIDALQAELVRVRREVDVRAALREAEVEEDVRSGLVHAPAPLVDLRAEEAVADTGPQVADEVDDEGPVAPPVPSLAELRTPSHRVDAFFDALLGP